MNRRWLFQSIQSTNQRRGVMKGWLLFTSILIPGLLLAFFIGMGQAQGPDEGDEIEGVDEMGSVSSVVPIQGLLTDASGNPLEGGHTITATLYDASIGGSALCLDEDLVTASKGLFKMNMHHCTASDISGDQLYMGIQVGSDPEMTPRQPIYAVPYAWTVKPGAIIQGDTSYLFTPGSAFVKNNSSDSTRYALSGASARIYRGVTAGGKYVRIPITIPSVLYGQDVRVTHVRVYYKCQNGSNNYITETRLYKMTDADSWSYLVKDETNLNSNTATSHLFTTDSDYQQLSISQGSLALYLELAFANDSEYIQIGGVRLTLDTAY